MDVKEELLAFTVRRYSNMALLGPNMYTMSRLTRYIANVTNSTPLLGGRLL